MQTNQNRILPNIWPIILIVLAAVAVYSNTFQASFHFDDYLYIVDKKEIRDLSDLKSIYHALGHPSRFISFLSFAINYHFHGYDVFGYHLVNLIIHAINGICVYGLVKLLFKAPIFIGAKISAHSSRMGMFAALIFVVHPVQTEAVTYIVQRFTSLATMFYLLSIICYLCARLAQNSRQIMWWLGFVVSALLGMFTKQICFTIPFIVILIELVFFEGGIKKLIQRQWFLLLILAAMILIIPSFFGFSTQTIIFREYTSRSHTGDPINTNTYFLTQSRVLMTYLRLWLFPIGQTLDYDFKASTSWLDIKVILSFLTLIGLNVYAIFKTAKYRMLGFGVLWFFITISVTSSIIPIPQVIFEHRMYLPLVGFCMAFSVYMFRLMQNVRSYTICMSIIVSVLALLSFQRNNVWQTSISLWEDIVQKAPNKVRVHNNLGMAYLEAKEYARSIPYFNQAQALNPDAARVYNNRALAYKGLGDDQQALVDYTKGIERYYASQQYRDRVTKPIWGELFNNRGDLWVKLKRYDQAFTDYQEAVRINPKNEKFVYNLGYMYELRREFKKALELYQQVIQINSEWIKPYIGIAFILRDQSRPQQALKYFNQALELNADSGEAFFYRAITHYELKNLRQAKDDMQRSVELGYSAPSTELKKVRAKILGLE